MRILHTIYYPDSSRRSRDVLSSVISFKSVSKNDISVMSILKYSAAQLCFCYHRWNDIILVGDTYCVGRQICPTGEKTHWKAVLESHTRCLLALRCMTHFPPFPQPKKHGRIGVRIEPRGGCGDPPAALITCKFRHGLEAANSG